MDYGFLSVLNFINLTEKYKNSILHTVFKQLNKYLRKELGVVKIKKPKSLEGFFFYDVCGHRVSRLRSSVVVSQKQLPGRMSGNCVENQERLPINLKRGTVLDIALCDPIFLENVQFITRRTTYMPKMLRNEMQNDKKKYGYGWLTFLLSDGSLLFVFDTQVCRAEDATRKYY